MNKRETTVIILLASVAVLLLSVGLVSISSLGSRLNGIAEDLNSLRSEFRTEISGIANTFHQMQEEAAWWEPGEIEVVEQDPRQAAVRVEWYIKDYRAGSKVYFNYRRQGEADYTSLEAETGSSGYFHALLEMELDPEPQWQHVFTWYDNGGSGSTAENVIDVLPDYDSELQYEYYISILDGDAIRTGDVEQLSLDKLAYGYYSTLSSNVDVEKNNIHISMLEEMYEQPRYTVTRAVLELCKGGGAAKKISLDRSDRHDPTKEWETDIEVEAGVDYDTLGLVVTYSDGKTFSRQVAATQ